MEQNGHRRSITQQIRARGGAGNARGARSATVRDQRPATRRWPWPRGPHSAQTQSSHARRDSSHPSRNRRRGRRRQRAALRTRPPRVQLGAQARAGTLDPRPRPPSCARAAPSGRGRRPRCTESRAAAPEQLQQLGTVRCIYARGIPCRVPGNVRARRRPSGPPQPAAASTATKNGKGLPKPPVRVPSYLCLQPGPGSSLVHATWTTDAGALDNVPLLAAGRAADSGRICGCCVLNSTL